MNFGFLKCSRYPIEKLSKNLCVSYGKMREILHIHGLTDCENDFVRWNKPFKQINRREMLKFYSFKEVLLEQREVADFLDIILGH